MLVTKERLEIRAACAEDAPGIKEIYESVFGLNGVKAPGHEAYPAPDMFSEAGVLRAIEDPHRELLVIDKEGTIAGGMVIHKLNPYHVEFACVAVAPEFRGLGLSPRMLGKAKALARDSILTLNNTEIVTHSMYSQCAHAKAGYYKVTGFNFCQYPRVFFKDHEESCSWVSSIDGKVAELLEASKKCDKQDQADSQFGSNEEKQLFQALSPDRPIYLPENLKSLVDLILNQFADQITYRTYCSGTPKETPENSHCAPYKEIYLDEQVGEPFTYLYLPGALEENWQSKIDSILETAKNISGKHFIQARLSANFPATIDYASYLEEKGFVIMGLLPLYNLDKDESNGKVSFGDALVLQWIEPSVLERNQLPGDTDSVPKLHGLPLGINGALVKTMRRQFS